MSIKIRLTIMNFLQFFIWGAWLTSLGVYLGNSLEFTGSQIASVFATMGIAAVIMPTVIGIIADKWINAERLLCILHIGGGLILFLLSETIVFEQFFWLMLLYNCMYMSTLGLSNSLAYNTLKSNGLDVIKSFPPIRVWGTVGFIGAMWLVDICQWTTSNYQIYLASAASLLYGIYALTLPKYIREPSLENTSIRSILGLDALYLFKKRQMAVFFIFSMLIGSALQITNTFGQPFLTDFSLVDIYSDSFTVRHPGILTSISQISEALFILAIPFFLRKYGIKTVMLMSIGGWVLRFGLFGIGDPGSGFVFLLLSMVVYGLAFDFFQISGSLFIEQQVKPSIRVSAQGIFIFMTNGVGTIIGTKLSGWVVDHFTNADGYRNWESIWFVFSGYALVLGILFLVLFNPKKSSIAS
ncbi:MAG TPA: nucleoside permease [Dysgonomonas sp.]|uniref:nucleoside permease n=1 Tax=unclassified Dysgonomonas TaxID=2630389 RepID=UPI0025B7FD65|nr:MULTISPECIES: nucleoside permease [unclassified Dysgonomonas]HML66017.1 nucleoside permease [Dysgonomonas sp.]